MTGSKDEGRRVTTISNTRYSESEQRAVDRARVSEGERSNMTTDNEPSVAEHDSDCRWQRTTATECEYRETHFYCPHPEHACNCKGPVARVRSDLAERIRRVADSCVVPEFAAKLRETAAECEAWEREHDDRH